jgi:Tol biopolymer transport system component
MAALATAREATSARRVGGLLIIVLGLILGAGCAGNDEVEPSGRVVLFGSPDLVLVSPAGGEVERLRIGVGDFWDASLSDDGRQVAFNPARGLEAGGITVMTVGDGRTTRIPHQPPQDEFASYDMAWAPDRKSIAFVHGGRVFTIGVDGNDRRVVGLGSSPTWTPDSEHVVFASGDNRGLDLDIAVIRVDGTGLRFLGKGLYPDVSPSGDEIAYSTPTGVFVLPFAGGTPRLVVPNGFGPVWSPDGRFLAFTRYTSCPTEGQHGVCSGRVFVVAAQGGEPRAIGPTVGDPLPPQGWIP